MVVDFLSAVSFIVGVVFDCFTNIRRGFGPHKKNLIYFLIKQVGVHTPSILLCASPLSPYRYKVRNAKLRQKYETKK